jgi:aldehyde dehydrogenase (NAD+)
MNYASKEEILKCFESQREFKFKLRNTDVHYRIHKLKKVKNLILDKKLEINSALQQDFNKPGIETDLTEIMPVISMINLLEKELASWMKPKKVKAPLLFKGTKSYVKPESKGNCLIISPWNYPFQLNAYPVLTAFAAGNTCMVKPSEFTPHTNKIIKDIFSEVFDEREISFFEGEIEVSNNLLDLPFDHIFFTGSTKVGSIVAEKAAKNLASVALELGGKSPCIVDVNCNISEAAKKIMWGKFVNSGQTCVAPDYVVTYKECEEEFTQNCQKVIKEFFPNEDFETSEDYSHIITERHAERLMGLVEDAKAKGASVHYGGELTGRIMKPTLLTGVNNDMQIMQEEIFGPLLPIVSFETKEDMINYINSFDNALATYVFSDNDRFADDFIENTSSGGVTVNDVLVAVGHPLLPFGGAGKSGIGRYHAHYGFEEFSILKPVLKRNMDLGATYFYPPYDDKKKGLVKTLLDKATRLF